MTDSTDWTGRHKPPDESEPAQENRLVDPKGTRRQQGQEHARNVTEAAVAGCLGPAAALLPGARAAFPSAADRRREAWTTQVTDTVNETSDRVDALEVGAVEQRNSLEAAHVELAGLSARVERHENTITTVSADVPDEVQAELENYRDLINRGHPGTARDFLEKRLDSLREGSGNAAAIAKATRLIAHCHHALGNDERASVLFEDAWNLNPSDPAVVAGHALGMLLNQAFEDALAFARRHLATDVATPELAAYMIEAHRLGDADGEPFDEVPAGMRTAAQVVGATLAWHRFHRNGSDWKERARKAAKRDPEDDFVRTYAAEAELEDLLADHNAGGLSLDAGRRERAAAAASVMEEAWHRERKREGGPPEGSECLLHNALVGWFLNGEGTRDIELARTFRSELEASDHGRPLLGNIARRHGDEDILGTLAGLDFPGGAMLRIEEMLNSGDWSGAREHIDAHADRMPPDVWGHVKALRRCVDVRLLPEGERTKAYVDLADTFGERLDGLLPLLKFMRVDECDEEATLPIRDRILAALRSGEPTAEERRYAAREAVQQRDSRMLIDALHGHVPTDCRSDELDLLAGAFGNIRPSLDTGLEFFDALAPDVAALPRYREARAVYDFNRGSFEDACDALAGLLQEEPGDLHRFNAYCRALYRSGDMSSLERAVTDVDPATMDGTPRETMEFVQLLHHVGRPEAYEIGYATVCANWDDPYVLLPYCGLFLQPKEDALPRFGDRVEQGSWVTLRDEHGDTQMLVVEDGPGVPHVTSVRSTDAWGQVLMGVRQGDTVQAPHVQVASARTVVDVTHRFVGLWRLIFETFEKRFPGVPGVWRITMKDDDISPILEVMEKQDAAAGDVVRRYHEHSLPLPVAARAEGGDILRFAAHAATRPPGVVTAAGDVRELAADLRAALTAIAGGGIVLDFFTLWLIAEGDWVGTLLHPFDRVVVPRTVLESFKDQLRDFDRDDEDGDRLTMSWHEGRVHAHSMSPEECRAFASTLRDRLAEIEARVEVVSTEAGRGLAPELHDILERSGSAFDAMIVAQREGLPLLSADRHARLWCQFAFGTSTVGLHALLSAVETEDGGSELRQEAVVLFDRWGLNYLPLAAIDLLSALDRDHDRGDGEITEFDRVARMLGTPNAEPASHLTVAIMVFSALWKGSPRDVRDRATGRLLEHLMRMKVIGAGQWINFLLLASLPSAFRVYLAGWIKGHFLTGPVLEARAAAIERASAEREASVETGTTGEIGPAGDALVAEEPAASDDLEASRDAA